MLSNCLVDIEKEVTRHITLANSLKERNEALSSKIVDLEFKLNERDEELLEERRSVARTNQSAEKWRNRCEKLEKDMILMRQTAEDTKNSVTVSNFQSSLAINLENVTRLEKESLQRVQRNDSRIKELEKKLENLEKTNSFLIQTATKQESNNEELRAANKGRIKYIMEKNQNLLEELEKAKSDASNVHNNTIKNCSQCSKNVEEVESMRMANQLLENELGQCTEEVEGLKNTVARKAKEIDDMKSTSDIDKNRSIGKQQAEKMATEKEKNTTKAPNTTVNAGKKKYIVIRGDNWCPDIWKDTVERISIFDDTISNLSQNVSSYHKEMFILIADITLEDNYLNDILMPICQNWKELRPDGEIHVIAWKCLSVSLVCSVEVDSLFTTLNTFSSTSHLNHGEITKAILQYWPMYAGQLLLPQFILRNH